MSSRRVRHSQVISPFGPGAVVDLVGESFVVEDAGRWRGYPDYVSFPRLAGRLGVQKLRNPPTKELPYYRFPRWLFCQSCRRMTHWRTEDEKGGKPSCQRCPERLHLVPMRFVAVCGNGHITDINWSRWAHSEPRDSRQSDCRSDRKLRFQSRSGVGGGLESLEVACKECGASRSLHGLTRRGALPSIGISCPGRQPWQPREDAAECDEQMMAVQRGASSVYYPSVVSAIDIPSDSDGTSENSPVSILARNATFDLLRVQPDHAMRDALIRSVSTETGLPEHEVSRELDRADDPDDAGTLDDIMPDEWGALCRPAAANDPRANFVTRRSDWAQDADSMPRALRSTVNDVVLVDRLREVRVLQGFERHTMQQKVSANLDPGGRDLLPAVEVFGEGFFLRFDEDRLREWEHQQDVLKRCNDLRHRQRDNSRWLQEATPRYVLLHTLAHLVLRNTAFEAGYSTSALRERLYVTRPGREPGMAGILVYTAAGDTEGTLGGLVRMGEHERLVRLLSDSVSGARWCSFDPVCWESSGQGHGGLSLAACHACALLPETSCVAGNRLLDRQLVVGEKLGFLGPLLAELDRSRAQTNE